MELEKMIFLRDFLFKTLLIGIVFGILYFIASILFWNTWLMSWIEHLFTITDAEAGKLTLFFFSMVRIVLVFFMLAPCLALHWMIKRKKIG